MRATCVRRLERRYPNITRHPMVMATISIPKPRPIFPAVLSTLGVEYGRGAGDEVAVALNFADVGI